MHVCIATVDFIGPVRNGGVGTASLGLAEALRDAGHRVSVLYASDYYVEGDAALWQAHYAAQDIRFYTPANLGRRKLSIPLTSRSLDIYEDLKQADYDIVHFPDYMGLGFYTAQAAALGQFDPTTAIVATLHGPTIWAREMNHTSVTYADLVRDAMERGCVECSDAVISPSAYLLKWAENQNWSLPTSYRVANALPRASSRETKQRDLHHENCVTEIVFFGRIEQRKGCNLFIDALGELVARGIGPDMKITFLGKFDETSFSRHSLGLRMQALPFRWKVIDDLHSSQAIDYLSTSPNCLAIIPSLDDNSPCAVYECLLHGIPIVATEVGGIPELIHDKDKAQVLVAPTSFALADAVQRILATGLQQSSPAMLNAESSRRLVAVHEEILFTKRSGLHSRAAQGRIGRRKDIGSVPDGIDSSPLISVCLVHRNRPEFLKQALQGYEDQEFRNFEVIIADNGSTDELALTTLRAWTERNPFSFPLRILEVGFNRFEVGGRNAAAAIARGAWLKFHDDDNVPKPHELRVFAEAMRTGRADAISCGLDMFSGSEMPTEATDISAQITFLGDGGAASYLQNVMGDSNFIIDRAVFESVGGFEERGFNAFGEDWNFLAKLKASGFVIGTIPQALAWYRLPPDNWALDWRRLDTAGARGRIRRTLAGHLSPEVQQLIAMAQSRGEPRHR